MRKAFAWQKLFTFFQQKILAYLRYSSLKFNKSVTNDMVSFEQLDHGSCRMTRLIEADLYDIQ